MAIRKHRSLIPFGNSVLSEVDQNTLSRQTPILKRFGTLHLGYIVTVIAATFSLFGTSGLLTACAIIGGWIFVFSKKNLKPGCAAVAIVSIGFVSLLCLPIYSAFFEPPSARDQCQSNLESLNRGFWSASSSPLFFHDLVNHPQQSWRVLILPYIGHPDLYEQYDLSQPWDSPTNIEILDKMPGVFCCPNRDSTRFTSYFVCSESNLINTKKNIWSHRNKLLLIEDHRREVPWTKPQDLTIDEVVELFAANSPQSKEDPGDCPHVYKDALTITNTGRTVLSVEGWAYTLPRGIERNELVPFLDESANSTGIWELDWNYKGKSTLRPNGVVALGLLVVLTFLPIVFLNQDGKRDQISTEA